jgi:hypothetical protein
MLGLRARGMVAKRDNIFESAVNGSLDAAFALRVRPRAGALGRQPFDEAGEAEQEGGRSDRWMSAEKGSMAWDVLVSAMRALLEELRTERERHLEVCMLSRMVPPGCCTVR